MSRRRRRAPDPLEREIVAALGVIDWGSMGVGDPGVRRDGGVEAALGRGARRVPRGAPDEDPTLTVLCLNRRAGLPSVGRCGDRVSNSLVAPLNVTESGLDEQNLKWKRLFNAVAKAQNRQQDGRPLLRLVSEGMASVRFASPAEYERYRTLVNERLLLSGFQVAEDRKLERVKAASTLDEAQQRADDLRAELVAATSMWTYWAFAVPNSYSAITFTRSWRRVKRG